MDYLAYGSCLETWISRVYSDEPPSQEPLQFVVFWVCYCRCDIVWRWTGSAVTETAKSHQLSCGIQCIGLYTWSCQGCWCCHWSHPQAWQVILRVLLISCIWNALLLSFGDVRHLCIGTDQTSYGQFRSFQDGGTCLVLVEKNSWEGPFLNFLNLCLWCELKHKIGLGCWVVRILTALWLRIRMLQRGSCVMLTGVLPHNLDLSSEKCKDQNVNEHHVKLTRGTLT